MHCPNCGNPATLEQQFCRTCGMSLVKVSELVTTHSGSPAGSNLDRVSKAQVEKEIVAIHQFPLGGIRCALPATAFHF